MGYLSYQLVFSPDFWTINSMSLSFITCAYLPHPRKTNTKKRVMHPSSQVGSRYTIQLREAPNSSEDLNGSNGSTDGISPWTSGFCWWVFSPVLPCCFLVGGFGSVVLRTLFTYGLECFVFRGGGETKIRKSYKGIVVYRFKSNHRGCSPSLSRF